MFYYLNGTVAHKEANLAVIDCGGVGYACRTTTNTLSLLNLGEKAKLYTYLNTKEDAFDLYGFSTAEELNLFRLLIRGLRGGAKGWAGHPVFQHPGQFGYEYHHRG